MKKLLSISALLFALLFGTQAQAAGQRPVDMTASGAIVGTQVLWCQTPGTVVDRACTFTQVAAYINSLVSGDCTATGTGTFTCLKVNGTAFGALATVVPGTGIAAALANNTGTAGAPVLFNGAGGTPSSLALASATGCTISGCVSGLGAGVATALAIAPGSAGAFVTFGGAGGTPSSITLTNGTGLPFTGVTGRFALSQAPQGIANSIWINPTGSTADMQNVAIPACANDGVHGLVYVNGTGLACASLTTGGGGTVTSVSAGCGTSTGGSAITTTGTVTAALTARTNTATSGVGADFVSSDCGGIVYDNSASSIAAVLPVATTSGFGANTFFARCNINAGVVTITPTTSTIGGASTLAIPGGSAAAPVCYAFQSNGTNYNLIDGPTVNASLLSSGTLAAARLPNPTASTLGGVESLVSTAHQWINTISTSGVPSSTQPAFTDISGSVATTQMPALTGDCTTSAGAVATTCTKTSGTAFGALATVTPGTNVATAAAVALSGAGGLTSTIFHGTAVLGTSAIASGACATVVTVAATNVATTDVVTASYNSDPTAVTGYGASATGAVLSVYPYPTSGNINVKVCNSTAGSITPSAMTLNVSAVR